MQPQVRPRRGRPPDPGVDRRVLDAVVDEIACRGVGGFSVNGVSARAGVSKRSISARWADRDTLILAGLAGLAADLVPPRTGRLRSDLTELAGQIAAMTSEPRRSVLAHCAAELQVHAALYTAFTRDTVDRGMAAVQDALVDARARGEIRSDVDLGTMSDCFVSAVVGSRSFGSRSPQPSADATSGVVLRQIVDLFTTGISSAHRACSPTVPATSVPGSSPDTEERPPR